MQRTTLFLTDMQRSLLQKEADQRGLRLSDVVRRAVDAYLQPVQRPSQTAGSESEPPRLRLPPQAGTRNFVRFYEAPENRKIEGSDTAAIYQAYLHWAAEQRHMDVLGSRRFAADLKRMDYFIVRIGGRNVWGAP